MSHNTSPEWIRRVRVARRLALVVSAMLLMLDLTRAQAPVAQPPAPDPPAPSGRRDNSEYVVGPRDVLTIAVRNQPSLSSRYIIDEDGTFSFPLIGRMSAAGLTLRAVETTLTARLADGFFNKPEVTVTIEEYRSQNVVVMCEVQQPGTYTLKGRTTLLEVLVMARSTTAAAAKEAIITRAGAAKIAAPGVAVVEPEKISLDLGALQTGDLTQNIVVQDGDLIFVPRAATVIVGGEVRAPGQYAIDKDSTVAKVLALAGWITDRGDKDRIRITRMVNGKPKESSAKLEDPVKPNDWINVKPKLF